MDNVDKDYTQLIYLPRKRNNFLLTVGALSTLGGLYYLANKINKKILEGESFTGLLQSCNVYKDNIFFVDEWIKKLIVPGGIYLTISNYFNERRNIETRSHYICKVMRMYDADLIFELRNIIISKSFENSFLGMLMEQTQFLRRIYYHISHMIGIYFYRLYKTRTNNAQTDYYAIIEKIENAIENFDEKKIDQMFILDRRTFLNTQEDKMMKLFQKICQNCNEKLKKNFEKKRIMFALLTVGLVSFCIYLAYRCFLGKKYIERNGLGNGDILTQFFYNNKWYTLIKLTCTNVDWIYWSLEVMQYVVLPGVSLIFFNKYLAYKNNNNLAYNLNRVFALTKNNFYFLNLDRTEEHHSLGLLNNCHGEGQVLNNLNNEYQEELTDIFQNHENQNKQYRLRINKFNDKMLSHKSLEDLYDMLYVDSLSKDLVRKKRNAFRR